MESKSSKYIRKGAKIGNLSVGERKRDGKRYYYECECDCGSHTKIDAWKLEQGTRTACRCNGQFLEIGKTYGHLKVQKRLKRGIYECSCSCGKQNVVVTTADVLHKKVTSRGCAVKPYNRKLRKDSTTGIRGVTFNQKTNKFQVTIYQDGKNRYLGSYSTKREAELIRKTAEEKMKAREQISK